MRDVRPAHRVILRTALVAVAVITRELEGQVVQNFGGELIGIHGIHRALKLRERRLLNVQVERIEQLHAAQIVRLVLAEDFVVIAQRQILHRLRIAL